jgi:Putative auto-transporter adhesin, head GIN domain
MRTMAIAGAILILGGCSAGARTSDSQHRTAQRSFTVGAFERISLSGSPDVIVTVGGGAPTVRAEGDADAVERLEIVAENGELRIGTRDGGHSWSWFSHHDRGVTIHITVPSLSGAAIAGSGGIRIDRVEGPRFAGSVTGSGDLNIAAVQAAETSFSVTGSGDIRVAGGGQRTTLSVTGSGDIDLSRMQIADATAAIVGSGDISVRATGTASVNIQGSGDVTVTGGARCSVNKAGSGDAHCDAPSATAAAAPPPGAAPAPPAPPVAPAPAAGH